MSASALIGLYRSLSDPLIFSKSDGFNWLNSLAQTDRDRFFEQLYELMAVPELFGPACVIDRPGYNSRYREKYGRERWSLCKTAFAIAVERAAKYARNRQCKLKVYVERSDRKTDRWMKQYYDELRDRGCPFNADRSGKYHPLAGELLGDTLYDFEVKSKTSPLMQLADLYLWPMCVGGYDPDNRTYRRRAVAILRMRCGGIQAHCSPLELFSCSADSSMRGLRDHLL